MHCNPTIEQRESQLILARQWCLQQLSRLGIRPYAEPLEADRPADVVLVRRLGVLLDQRGRVQPAGDASPR